MDDVIVNFLDLERRIPEEVLLIRSTLKEKHKLIVPNHCDQFIARCLRLKDGDREKAIKLIKSYQAALIDLRGWDVPILPSLYKDFYLRGTLTPLLRRDLEGRRVFVLRPKLWDPKEMTSDEALAGVWMLTQYGNAEFIDAQRNGYVIIWDFTDFTIQQAWAVRQWRLISCAKWAQNSVIGRIKAVHAIFHPKVIGVMYAAIRPFLKEKLKKRIMFHDSPESLHKHVPSDRLPTYLGGTLGSEECMDESVLKELIQQDDFFKDIMDHGFPSK